MVTISFSKRDLVWFVPLVMIMVVGFVVAFNPTGTGGIPSEMGHSMDEIEIPICLDGQILEYFEESLVCGNDDVGVAGIKMTSGTYKGDKSVNRPIAHGLGVTPKLVVISKINKNDPQFYDYGGPFFRIHEGIGRIFMVDDGSTTSYLITSPDSTNFYVGSSSSSSSNANNVNFPGGFHYYWTAFG